MQSYFQRIGYHANPVPSLETLTELHRLHTHSIPFENLTPFIFQEVSLDQQLLTKKLVESKRGGYCFEQNSLFLNVLQELGFKARGLGARVLWNRSEDLLPRRSHMLIAVDLPEGTYLADVGFGGLTLTTPIKLELGAQQATTHESFKLEKKDNDIVLRALVQDAWKTLYRFDLQEQHAEDYEVVNYYLYTHPSSIFRNSLIAAKPTHEGRLALNNTQFTFYSKSGEVHREQLGSVEKMRDVLSKKFGLDLDGLSGLDTRLQSLLSED